jgi:hypothetical protein
MVNNFLPLQIFTMTYIFFESKKLFDTELYLAIKHLPHKNFKNKKNFGSFILPRNGVICLITLPHFGAILIKFGGEMVKFTNYSEPNLPHDRIKLLGSLVLEILMGKCGIKL